MIPPGLLDLLGFAAGPMLWTALVLCARIAPAVLLLPVFGGLRASPMVRMGVVSCLVFACWPASLPALPSGVLSVWAVWASQLIAGLSAAVAALLFFEAARMTGALFDVALGRGSLGDVNPLGSGAQGPLATLHALLFVAVFAAVGGHVVLIGGFVAGFELFPLDAEIELGALGAMTAAIIGLSSSAIAAAIALALPGLAVAVVVDLSLGWLSRTLPGLPALFIAMPLRMVLGWIVVAAVLAAGLPWLIDASIAAVPAGLP